MTKRIGYIIDEILDQYMYADLTFRPWIIGFSGGKDSTVLLTLVWLALRKIKEQTIAPFQLRRPIYVVCNDTMVENPIIATYVDEVLNTIEIKAREEDLPIFVRKTVPKLEDSFWVNVIGKGYPVPNTAFRWCTEKMKIKPTARFITEQVDECGEAIILIGTRKTESATRARSIKKHEIHGKRLTNHTILKNTYVYAPIKELMLEEVWYIINAIPSPWGFDNSILFNIYKDASADDYECPTVVTDKSHGSCGQSRFGCWTCTVVKDDKSMRSLIQNGREWMRPLYDFRLQLDQERNIIENRMPFRRDGRKAVNDMGSYVFRYRASILERLLQIQYDLQQKDPNIKLITDQELIAIQVNWYRDFNFTFQVSEIYNKIYNTSLYMEEVKVKNKLEADLMKEVCKDNIEEGELIEQLLLLQKSKSLMQRRRGLKSEIESRIEEFVKNKKK
ncbi:MULTISPECIES: DNA phosphorothioation system sulfurtransferase DndC [Alistipes]|jgi:DNA sulfur modification protein DndC|uniref:DNA phosphorothioation system sulfurtransferase DndC n=3 Tax=Alistipes TaxID=239759 RepID=A0ABY5V5W5_9BACT|nr:DNA phosphorothioation system sulfurtransferase DndC [Alistipes senegalensis]UEA87981.1 DNA phosphorothioation system sulfurtransferase DndC [Alistipes senegalensis]UWN64429.1 DNA phosphorothioation system sulfurtransferase DndC [Alistipes senegalensis JC50]